MRSVRKIMFCRDVHRIYAGVRDSVHPLGAGGFEEQMKGFGGFPEPLSEQAVKTCN